ncbi:TATA box-binding protein-associated factor RNA polymerase I subunit B [Leptopilina heterotoma]|uniref:TATA box-binding protein-associated factor RNA polymerase I subunit B n=1 Tax=Leptopilina heterotoma TaxID=63436 RepID=UPI001CA85DD0|nr:TATA box-binding protein-associated factor RNA polymerase I subunit B [Leptopilina heterotoma]
MSNTQICEVCRSTNFEIIDGNFFCTQCFTQNDNIQENVRETRIDPTTRIRSIGRIKAKKADKPIEGWTSWELYNFVIYGLTNEAIELGAPSTIKLTVLQLWTAYLRKLEVAFTSKKKKNVPKLAKIFNKRDAEIIYGKIEQRKKRKRRKNGSSATSMVSSFQSSGSTSHRASKKSLEISLAEEYEKASSANDSMSSFSANQSLVSLQSSFSQRSSNKSKLKFNKGARAEARKIKVLSSKVSYSRRRKSRKGQVTTRYKLGPQVITATKLWAILHLAFRIHGVNIHLSDMLRYGKEGHLSYYKMDHLIPQEVSLSKENVSMLTPINELTHKGLRELSAGIANFLDVTFDTPNFLSLAENYCLELQLPRGILLYTERLLALCSPKMIFHGQTFMPNYEGRVMAFIIVVMKILFGMDGITEYEISRVAEKINMQATERDVLLSKLFSFNEWQRFIECRKAVLSEVHFPSNRKYNPEAPGNSHLFLRFLGLIQSKREGEQTPIVNTVKPIPELLRKGFQSCFDTLNENLPPMKEIAIFPASLTPQYSYIQQLLDDPYNDLPAILKINFYDTKVGYTTKPDLLEQLASQCDIELKIIDTNLHFVEKQVSEYNDRLVLSKESLSETVLIKDPKNDKIKSESLFDYLHRKVDSNVSVNHTKKKYYDTMKFSSNMELESNDEFNFDQVEHDGKLLIQIDSDSDNEELNKFVSEIDLTSSDNIAEKEFRKAYNLTLSKHEEKATFESKTILSKRRQVEKIYHRNERGRFTKIEEKMGEIKEEEEEASGSNENELTDDPEILNLKDFIKNRNVKNRCVSFRPYKDYWMYNCLFSRMRLNNFELFEKELPISFRWLLRVCADTIEMSELDLYEEVCLVEAYCTHILNSNNEKGDSQNTVNKKYLNSVLQKW